MLPVIFRRNAKNIAKSVPKQFSDSLSEIELTKWLSAYLVMAKTNESRAKVFAQESYYALL
jgi:hypothetical protein